MSKSDSFVHLHVHTDYSMLDGAAKIKQLIKEVAAQEMPAVAMTDHGNMHGAYEFYTAANEAGIKPIIGLEAYVTPGTHRSDRTPVRWNDGGEDDISGNGAYTHMTLLSETTEGMHNLFKMSSLSWLEGIYYKPRIDRELLNTYSKGIPCGDDVMCMQTTIAPSLFPHPTEAQERGEDKDLIFLAFVNPKVTASVASQKAKAGTTKTLTFKLTNLAKKPVSGTTVVFESFGEGGQPEEYSVISNAQGVVTVKVAAPKGTVGLQVVRAKVFGAQIGTDSKIYWGK
jgi:DNA polymerase III alpha subunit (gram-positive type)